MPDDKIRDVNIHLMLHYNALFYIQLSGFDWTWYIYSLKKNLIKLEILFFLEFRFFFLGQRY